MLVRRAEIKAKRASAAKRDANPLARQEPAGELFWNQVGELTPNRAPHSDRGKKRLWHRQNSLSGNTAWLTLRALKRRASSPLRESSTTLGNSSLVSGEL